jgi:hypothetical protein
MLILERFLKRMSCTFFSLGCHNWIPSAAPIICKRHCNIQITERKQTLWNVPRIHFTSYFKILSTFQHILKTEGTLDEIMRKTAIQTLPLDIQLCFLVGETECTWHVDHYLTYCTSPGWWMMMIVEQSLEWLPRETEVHCHFVHHKSHMIWPGLESGPPRREASDSSPELWHGVSRFYIGLFF